MTNELWVKEYRMWSGRYKGVKFEIHQWDGLEELGFTNCWSYCLIVPKIYTEPSEDETFLQTGAFWDDIYSHSSWFTVDTGKYIKAVCDYQHLFDIDAGYNYEYVLSDCKKSIDEYVEKVKRCQ